MKRSNWIASLFALAALASTASPRLVAQGAPAVPQIEFHHATISVANIQAEADWYMQKLGFSFRQGEKIAQINPMMQGTRLVIPGFQLDLIQFKGSQRPKLEGGVLMQQGFAHLAFVSPDVEGAYKALKAAGVAVEANGRPGEKLQNFTFRDPEGNEIEVFAR